MNFYASPRSFVNSNLIDTDIRASRIECHKSDAITHSINVTFTFRTLFLIN
jgi:hypothetical protein